MKVRLEGPYGAARYLPDLTAFDRVLLVAGGVGATFAVPVYRSALGQLDAMGALAGSDDEGAEGTQRKVKLVWFVRSEADASWGVAGDEKEREMWERNVEVVLTGKRGAASTDVDGHRYRKGGTKDGGVLDRDEDIELAEREALLDEGLVDGESEEAVQKSISTVRAGGRERLSACIDEFLAVKSDGMVAVLVCGPPGMARSVRAEIRMRAEQGMQDKQVFFHAEEFAL